MKTKKIFWALLSLCLCLTVFVACSDDDEDGNSGLAGVYTTSTFTNGYDKELMCNVLVLTKHEITYFKSAAVQGNSSFWGSSTQQVPGLPGWYADGPVTSTYFVVDNVIYTEGGDMYVVSGNTIRRNGTTYTKK